MGFDTKAKVYSYIKVTHILDCLILGPRPIFGTFSQFCGETDDNFTRVQIIKREVQT